jgi:hypothetical protein
MLRNHVLSRLLSTVHRLLRASVSLEAKGRQRVRHPASIPKPDPAIELCPNPASLLTACFNIAGLSGQFRDGRSVTTARSTALLETLGVDTFLDLE